MMTVNPSFHETQPLVIAFGSDHAGFLLKKRLLNLVEKQKYVVIDCGTMDQHPVDYPDFAERVFQKVLNHQADRGVLICGTGIGMAMAANRHRGIRAACCYDVYQTLMARQHNDANVLCLGERVVDEKMAHQCLITFLQTEFEGGRHQRRLDKID